MYTYHCHNTKFVHLPLSQYKHVHIPLSQYKICTRTTVTTQNAYTYHCQNTKHLHVLHSQYKIFTRTTVTIQNMYTYHYHNTKRVHIPLSKYKTFTRNHVNTKRVHIPHSKCKTCTRTTVTVQNRYTYHIHKTKHIHVSLGTANTNACSLLTGFLGWFAGWQVWSICGFSNLKRLVDRGEPVFIFEHETLSWYTVYVRFSLYFSTLKTILKV